MSSMKICSFEGCGRKHEAKGLCQGHYTQQCKGKELRPLQADVPIEDRFMNFVEKTDSCWLWKAYTLPTGYAQFTYGDRKKVLAHRFSYKLFVGPVDKTDVVHHTCHVRNCVNPAHLQAVTQAQNVAESLDRQNLLSRIEELEARVAELEASQMERQWNLT